MGDNGGNCGSENVKAFSHKLKVGHPRSMFLVNFLKH